MRSVAAVPATPSSQPPIAGSKRIQDGEVPKPYVGAPVPAASAWSSLQSPRTRRTAAPGGPGVPPAARGDVRRHLPPAKPPNPT